MRYLTILCGFFALLFTSLSAYAALNNEPMLASALINNHNNANLHLLVFWLCIGIGILVFGILLYILIFYRKSKEANFHKRSTLEILWTLIPLIILIALIVPAGRILIHANNNNNHVFYPSTISKKT